jgi:hypothetical protein
MSVFMLWSGVKSATAGIVHVWSGVVVGVVEKRESSM